MSWLLQPGAWVILLSFVAALVLEMIALPPWADALRPDWLGLILIYWCMTLPERVGIGTAWLLGLLFDAANGGLLGQHALALTLLAFLAVKTHRRVRVFPLWQQTISVLLFLLVARLLIAWINGIIGYPPADVLFLLPVLSSMLVWPLLFVILRDLRRDRRIV